MNGLNEMIVSGRLVAVIDRFARLRKAARPTPISTRATNAEIC